MNKKGSRSKIETTKKLVDIESRDRLTSKSINKLSNNPELLKEYLEASLTHSFSELLFRLTYEIYTEDKASNLWDQIVIHKTNLENIFGRDVGILVAALDYFTFGRCTTRTTQCLNQNGFHCLNSSGLKFSIIQCSIRVKKRSYDSIKPINCN